jgi:hypothetical protein
VAARVKESGRDEEGPFMAFAYPLRAAPSDRIDPRYGLTLGQRRLLSVARTLAHLFDTRFNIFGFRFGIDPLVGLVPVVGDVLPGLVSLYMLWVGRQLGVPTGTLVRMSVIGGVDVLIGMIPFVGAIGDAFYRAQMRNLRIIEEHVRRIEEDLGLRS